MTGDMEPSLVKDGTCQLVRGRIRPMVYRTPLDIYIVHYVRHDSKGRGANSLASHIVAC